jgi:hypothetical protein
LAPQVLSRIGDAFGVELSITDLLDNPTTEELALTIEELLLEEFEHEEQAIQL